MLIVEVALKTLFLGMAAEFFQKNRLQRVWSFLLWGGFLFCVFPLFMDAGKNTQTFIYHWIVSPVINVDITLGKNAGNEMFLRLLTLVGSVVLFYNIFYPAEKERLRSGGLYLFIYTAALFLCSAENIMQLLIGACIVDVLGFYLIRDTEARKKYVFYNLLADMALMVALAMIWGKTGDLSLAAVKTYFQAESMPLAAVLILGASMSKSGLFLFHDNLLDLKRIILTRSMFVMLAATPLSGIVLLYKLSGIFELGFWLKTMTAAFALLTMLWAGIGAVLIDNLKAKMFYFAMLMYGFLFGVLNGGAESFFKILPVAVIITLLTIILLMLPVVAASNEQKVSAMGAFFKKAKFLAFLTFGAVLCGLSAILNIIAEQSAFWGYLYLAVWLCTLSLICRQIYFGRAKADDTVWALLKTPNFVYWLPLVMLGGAAIFCFGQPDMTSGAAFALFLALMLYHPLRFSERFYSDENVQSAEPLSGLYGIILISPVKILGRILWLLVDFLLIERTFLGILTSVTHYLVRLSIRLHSDKKLSAASFILVGAAVLVISYYWERVSK